MKGARERLREVVTPRLHGLLYLVYILFALLTVNVLYLGAITFDTTLHIKQAAMTVNSGQTGI